MGYAPLRGARHSAGSVPAGRGRRGHRGPDTRPGRCLRAGGATAGGATAGGTTAATALGGATAILGLLGIAVGGIWPLPGAAGDLAGIRISPGMALVLLGTGAALLRAVGSRGE